MDLKERIEAVKELEIAYLSLIRIQCNSNDAIRAFHSWYNAMLVLFNKCVPADNEDFQYIKNKETSGTGFILKDTYNEISGRCAMLMDDIENGKYSAQAQNNVTINEPECVKRQLVFISHASADKAIIKEFIDKILKEGLGLRDENIACTSFEATGVTIGDDIPGYIKENIAAAKVVLAMVSKAYKASEVCQNEVSAAWALGNRPIQILLPDVDFEELGWLLHLKKAAKIDSQECLDHLEEVLCDRLGLSLVSPRHWNPCVNAFLEKFKSNSSLDDSSVSRAKGNDKAIIRVTSEKIRIGQCALFVKNEGISSARNLKVDLVKSDCIESTRPLLPAVFDEISPGDHKSIICALIEGAREIQLQLTWDDDFKNGETQIQTIAL